MSEPPLPRETAEQEFHVHYGAALAGWTLLEANLGRLFEMIIGGSPLVASHVFFSARSFQGRVEMLLAAIRAAGLHASGNKEALETARVIARKADDWSSSRNRLAHDIPAVDYGGKSKVPGQFIIMPGKAAWRAVGMQSLSDDHVLTIEDMKIMRENFSKLNTLLAAVLETYPFDWPPPERLRTVREQVLLLPRLPYTTAPTPKREARAKPPRSSRK